MARNTPNPIKQVTATTAGLAAITGNNGEIVVDANKHTLVVLDGATPGGNPLAKEAVTITAGTPNVKINNGSSATLGSSDITISVLPGTMPTGVQMVENPAGQPAGIYLEYSYTDANGQPAKYYIDMAKVVDIYTAGAGITIESGVISVDATQLVTAVAKPGEGLATDEDGKLVIKADDLVAAGDGLEVDENGKLTIKADDLVAAGSGLAVDSNGKLTVDLSSMLDANGPLKMVDGKLTINLVSADSGNNLKAGSDGGVYFPSDLGSL